MMRSEYRSFGSCAALLIVSTVISSCAKQQPSVQRKETQESIPVKLVSASETKVQRTTSQPATVHPYYQAEIRAKVSGYVGEIKADIGDVVEAGETLAIINVPEMRKQREIIEARITRFVSEEARAQAGVALAEAHVRSAEAKLAQAKSEMSRADASLAAMEAEFNRTQDLVQRQSLESRVLDEVRKKRDSERANKEATASAIHSADADVAVAQAQLTSAQADLKADQAETDIARRQLEEIDVLIDYSTLKAPFNGIVTQRHVDPGDLVRETSEVGSGKPLFVISQMETVRVHIPVPEVDAALVRRGDTVTLRFPSFPAEEPMTASVTRLAGVLDPSTRTMLVEAEVQNTDRKLIPGMFGEASISLSTKIAATILPARAVRFSESGDAYVYIVEEDSTVSISPVKTGLDDGHSIEILAGLSPGQQVIDAHLKRFTDGEKVVPLSR
ncbi:Multidrug resistance protein MdtA precursor [Thalassoglobus neptunius]|uniref:Multidrug resistance protein MdtA n=1 Tax=Thalassoglobus neptunius TaxID=1938619 RepID=A0A5C5VN06_9PLAN|nr:efflux RND transporter periplasmic adaptor subunit [Thalassoglobus neptunius]TWT40034.1 Multidrug resistance protein MdtA precursor [Thalassoglobus neptunius]